MNARDKFERAIQVIEELISVSGRSSQEIAMEVAKDSGLQLRDMSTVFNYLLDTTLNSYITRRRLVAAYRYLLSSKLSNKKADFSYAAELAGYWEQSSFIRAFKKQFNVTPREAYMQSNSGIASKCMSPVTWDELSGNPAARFDDIEGDTALEETTTFGISDSAFHVITEALELETFYGLPRIYSNFAYNLSQTTDYSLSDCFKYAASVYEYCGLFEDWPIPEEEMLPPDIMLYDIADDEQIQEVFFARHISFEVIYILMSRHNASLEDLMQCDLQMLARFPGFEQEVSIDFKYYMRAYEYYVANLAEPEAVSNDEMFDDMFNEDGFELYLDRILIGMPMESALERIYPFAVADYDPVEMGILWDLSREDVEDDYDIDY